MFDAASASASASASLLSASASLLSALDDDSQQVCKFNDQ